MQQIDVYDTKNFIVITNPEGGTKQETGVGKYRASVLEFFRRLKSLPTKYDLTNTSVYVIPREVRPHMPGYSKETVFPRARVLPDAASKTKWQLFAERKGIKKNRNKRGGRVYNEETREHAPAFGRGSKRDLDTQWLIEVKEQDDPMVDRHAELKLAKKEHIRINKNRKLRNEKRRRKAVEI